MKTVIGFVCGIAGMVLSVAIFVSGMIAGVAINELDLDKEPTKYKAYKDRPKYTDWANQNKED